MPLVLRYAVRSDKGLVRSNNEDSVYAGPRLLAIADGMGGHAAGEVASTTVIEALERLDEDRPVEDLLGELRRAVEQANADVAHRVRRDPDLDGMGTTLTALRFAGSRVGLVHVGDSRAYLARGGTFAQITHDDTYVQSLVDAGRLTAEEAAHHPRKSVILRAITGTDVEPDVSIREARAGDRYLLCSDGLSDVVSVQTLAETVARGTPQECADRLVELALRGGGPDNVTCVVADVVERGSGWEDDVPVIGGALDVADGSTLDEDTEGLSSAERAATMVRPVATPAAAPAPAGRRRRRTWVTAFVVAVVIVGGGGAFYAWTQTQYYVGESGQKVSIFRGVDAAFGPLKFSSVEVSTDVDVAGLTPAARGSVAGGITATSRADAQAIVARLQGLLLPLCDTPEASASVSAQRSPTAGDVTPTTPTTPTTATAASPSAGPTPADPATVSPAGPTSTAPAAPVLTPRPGVDCRTAP